MAFKLTGDNFAGMKLGKKRRVSELLLSGIPEEEAMLTRSGKYACLVCGHGPVFDTVAVLSVHRRGRRHIQASTRKLCSREIKKIESIRSYESESEVLPPLLAKVKQVKQDCHPLSLPLVAIDTHPPDRPHPQQSMGEKREHNNDDSVFVYPWKQVKKLKMKNNNQQPLEQPSCYTVSMRSSGWIPNGDGSWRKDPNVEFDSDESEPD